MSDQQDLLFELGCEELPPKSLLSLSQALLKLIEAGLQDAELGYQSAHSYATPRRLAVIVNALNRTQTDKQLVKRGPPLALAFAKDGSASQAAVGFAQSCGTTVEQLERLKTDKGEWLLFKQQTPGLRVEQLIPAIIQQSIAALPIAKRMRWGNYSSEFARPVHWCVLLFGSQLIAADILGLTSTRQSRGHRFHAPQKLSLKTAADYLPTLEQSGKVIADFAQRQRLIKAKADAAAKTVDGNAHIEPDLLAEVTALTEWPVAILGSFDARFLSLPTAVLITTMQTNQKYFPVKNKAGDLLPYFITISNLESSNPESIKRGNERVILPRLADAEFFWKQDRKLSLQARVSRLKSIVFQQKLGTVAAKTERVENLAAHIARQLKADPKLAQRAAHLAKADLLTTMVGEFASLQGIMGRYYALADNEPAEVAMAIEEQYFPKQSGGLTPPSKLGQILSLAEKIDTLAGIFSVGLIPSGDKDPYALKRAALGTLRIIIEHQLALNSTELIAFALEQFNHEFDKNKTQQLLLTFIYDRLKGYCLERGHSADAFAAVMAVAPQQPFAFMQRMQALKTFRQLPQAASLVATNKRITNLLKKSKTQAAASITGLVEAQEIRLHRAALQVAKDIQPLLEQHQYTQALTRLAQLKEVIDDFFDQVMVNTDNAALCASRLALLSLLSNQFLKIADIAKLH